VRNEPAQTHVLDASAVLAWLQQETGAHVVDPLLDGGVMSAANWAEVLQKAQRAGVPATATALSLKALGVRVEPVLEEDATAIVRWWFEDSALSLGDRCCLALAQRLGGRAVTAEGAWQNLNTDVLVIR
jgi:PIN domain nuclease of toxin-antitoxin system